MPEVARVGHHADVEHFGLRARDARRAPHLLDYAVEEVARTRRRGIREHEVERLGGVEVVVYEHALGRGVRGNQLAEGLQTRERVEVHAEYYVGLLDGAGGAALVVVLEYDHVVNAGHPVQIVWIFVGYYAGDGVAHASQRLGPRQRRTYGIAVGVGVREGYDLAGRHGEHLAQSLYVGTRYFHCQMITENAKVVKLRQIAQSSGEIVLRAAVWSNMEAYSTHPCMHILPPFLPCLHSSPASIPSLPPFLPCLHPFSASALHAFDLTPLFLHIFILFTLPARHHSPVFPYFRRSCPPYFLPLNEMARVCHAPCGAAGGRGGYRHFGRKDVP